MADKVYTCIGARNKDCDFLNIKGSGAISYSWFIWEKGYKSEPKVRWLNYD